MTTALDGQRVRAVFRAASNPEDRFDLGLDAWIDDAGEDEDEVSACERCPRSELDELPVQTEPTITINRGVVISENAIRVLKGLLEAAGLTRATVTSGRRDSGEQARVMFDLIARNGVDHARRLYASAGRQVVDVYAAGKAAKQTDAEIRLAMRSKIVALGPSKVSKHASDRHDVIDVAPSSITDHGAFRRALDAALAAGTISKYIPPPVDPAFHIEIELPMPAVELAREFASAPALPPHALEAELLE